jgi:hypothetical protein
MCHHAASYGFRAKAGLRIRLEMHAKIGRSRARQKRAGLTHAADEMVGHRRAFSCVSERRAALLFRSCTRRTRRVHARETTFSLLAAFSRRSAAVQRR